VVAHDGLLLQGDRCLVNTTTDNWLQEQEEKEKVSCGVYQIYACIRFLQGWGVSAMQAKMKAGIRKKLTNSCSLFSKVDLCPESSFFNKSSDLAYDDLFGGSVEVAVHVVFAMHDVNFESSKGVG